MTPKIRTTETTLRPIRDTGGALQRIDPVHVQVALGAEEVPAGLAEALAPLTLAAVRQELVHRLQSSGGRPALAGTTRRAKIPLRDEEWERLEALATAMAAPGFAPSPGQVAGVLLSAALQAVVERLGPEPAASPLTHELQGLTKRCR